MKWLLVLLVACDSPPKGPASGKLVIDGKRFDEPTCAPTAYHDKPRLALQTSGGIVRVEDDLSVTLDSSSASCDPPVAANGNRGVRNGHAYWSGTLELHCKAAGKTLEADLTLDCH